MTEPINMDIILDPLKKEEGLGQKVPMKQDEQNLNDYVTITPHDLINTILKMKDDRGVFPDDIPKKNNYQELLEASWTNCPKKTKKIYTEFLLRFGKLYEKEYPELIDQLQKFEKTTENRKHRDHVCHSFWVWCLGYWFYQNGFNRFFSSVDHNIEDFHFVWYLTAFYHDIGYVNEHKFHGGDSAQILLKGLNDRFSGNWTISAIHAINAICYHDRKTPVDIKKNPYSALLIICDELQEWGRNIPGHKERYEIDEMNVRLHLNDSNPSVDISLFYQQNRDMDLNNLSEYRKTREEKYHDTITNRIQNLSIIVRCS